MSKFVEKTFDSLNTILSNSGLLARGADNTSSRIPSILSINCEAFANKLKHLDTVKERETFITSYISTMEKQLSRPDITNATTANIVKVCMTCELLGFPVPFVYIHALKLAQKGNLHEKHIGYLASSSFLNSGHELVILLVNTIQKDLCSSNHAEVMLALTSVCNLINKETVHNVVHMVEDKLKHNKASVRKLALLTFGHCLDLVNSPSCYQMAFPKLEKCLTDCDLDVVSSAVSILYSILLKVPGDKSYLINSLVQIQEQTLRRTVPSDMIYDDIPAPWLQIKILKMFAVLCKTSEHFNDIIPVLKKTMVQAEVNHQLAYAIIYQVIETVASTEASVEVIQIALSSVSGLLRSKNVNLKFMGVEALIAVFHNLKPSISAAQQEIIMECLKHPDEMLQFKTLELLYQLANTSNVQAVCRKMTEFFTSTKDDAKKQDLALKVLSLAKKHCSDKKWYISTVNSILLEYDHLLSSSDVCEIVDFIKNDASLMKIAKEEYMELSKSTKQFPSSVIKIIASVLTDSEEFIKFLPFLKECDEISTTWFLVSLQGVLLKTLNVSDQLVEMLCSMTVTGDVCEILHQLLKIASLIKDAKNIGLKEIDFNEEIDPSLTFLDSYVSEALENGAACYQSESLRSLSLSTEESPKFTARDMPSTSVSSEISITQNSGESSLPKSPSYNPICSPSISLQSLSYDKEEQISFAPTRNMWTLEGRQSKTEVSTAEKIQPEEKVDQEISELFAGIS